MSKWSQGLLTEEIIGKKGKKSFLFFLLLAILYLIASSHFWSNKLLKSDYIHLQKAINDFEYLTENKPFLNTTVSQQYATTQGKTDKSYIISQVYSTQPFQIISWSSSSVFLAKEQIVNFNQLKYIEINQKNYLIKSVLYNDKYIVLWFDIDQYLSICEEPSLKILNYTHTEQSYKILGYAKPRTIELTNQNGNYLFSIDIVNGRSNIWIIVNLLLIVFMAFYLLNTLYIISKNLCKINSTLGVLTFGILIYLLRKILLYYKLPSLFYTLKLFNPSLYSSELTPSLGDLLLFVVSSQLIIVFVSHHLRVDVDWIKKYKLSFIFHTLVLIFLMGEAFSINKIFDRMVVESSIWFNFNYFPRLSIYSFIGLAIMLMSFSNYYLLSNFLLKIIVSIRLNLKNIFLSFSVVLAIVIYVTIYMDIKFETKLTLFILLFFIATIYLRHYIANKSRLIDFGLFLLFASSTTTFLLYQYNSKKELVILNSIASNVAFGRDTKTEEELIHTLESDTDISEISTGVLKTVSIQKIDELDFQNYLEDIYPRLQYNRDLLIKSNQRLKLFFDDTENDKKYIAEVNRTSQKDFYIIYPKNYLNNISHSIKNEINDLIVRENKISYGMYSADTLIDFSGLFSYNPIFDFDTRSSKIVERFLNFNYEHHIFSFDKKLKVVVSTEQVNPVSIITQFSYIFCINFLLTLILFSLATVLRFDVSATNMFKLQDLRSKIVWAIFLIVITIFSGITYLSYNSLKEKYSENNRILLMNNIKTTQYALSQLIMEGRASKSIIQSYFLGLKKYNNQTYKLYNQFGVLDMSTEPNEDIEYPSLIAPNIFSSLHQNPTKIYELFQPNSTSPYEIATAIKAPELLILTVSNKNNINSQAEASKLIVVLINLYVIFFLISMLFAVWLANRISQPLRLLTDRITHIGISKQNEYIEYKYNDEIGELVKRYNVMVDEIQQSAKQMVAQEREQAWSEMAKQIAHEIKNPLTPMKLKIQYLQRKIGEGHSDITKLASSTADTLIEQINNLDTIATSFSNFAKLHHTQEEIIEWKELIAKVASVFENNNDSIEIKTSLSQAYIYGDRNQMVSLLNNLIKNGIQACEQASAKIILELKENETYYILHIIDNGKGIEEELKDKIFTPNFTTKSSGTGLGLAISKKIVDNMNGYITFYPREIEGTEFVISIPKYKVEIESSYTSTEKRWLELGFIEVSNASIATELRYASPQNIFNRKLYLDFDKPFLHTTAYTKLQQATQNLTKVQPNYRLLILDALRPYSIQQTMWDNYKGLNKEKYIASPEKDSMHNYGMAVDVLIIETFSEPHRDNRVLDFGCEFDTFDERANFDYANLTPLQASNRALLRTIMKDAGFIPYDNEFWHFEAMHKDWVRKNCTRI